MKRITFCLVLLTSCLSIYSQENTTETNPKWDRQGNATDTSDFIGTINASDLKVKTNSEERLRITSSGNVGVGVQNPSEKLEVDGTIRAQEHLKVDGNLYVTGSAEVMGQVQFFDTLYLKEVPLIGEKDIHPDIIVKDSNGMVKRMVYSDYIGLPYEPRLCFHETRPTWASVSAAQLGGGEFDLGNIYTTCANVGIGTNSPIFNLDVAKSGRFRERLLISSGNSPAAADLHVRTSTTNTSARLLLVENTERKLLQLDNSGMLRAREIKVDMQNWPDYVFKKEYTLLPLHEVESFIKENGHLPNVPSAEELEEDGLNLAESNRMLMEKVEELTLYLIEQNKRITELEKALEQSETK